MTAGKAPVLAVLTTVLLLSACSSGDEPARLMNLRPQGEGPDEFAILPSKPLEIPADLTALPEPQPGGANLVDPRPLDDAVVALGGRPGAGSNDAALVAAAGRNGTAPGIREQLAEEDAEFRSRQKPKLLERLLGRSTYHSAYANQATRPRGELEAWRGAGARTPAVPPADTK